MTSSRTRISARLRWCHFFYFQSNTHRQGAILNNVLNTWMAEIKTNLPIVLFTFSLVLDALAVLKSRNWWLFPKGLRMTHCVHVLPFIYSTNLLEHSWTKCFYSTEDMAVSKRVKCSPWVHAHVCAIVCVFPPSTHLLGCLMRAAMWHLIMLTLAMKGTGS